MQSAKNPTDFSRRSVKISYKAQISSQKLSRYTETNPKSCVCGHHPSFHHENNNCSLCDCKELKWQE